MLPAHNIPLLRRLRWLCLIITSAVLCVSCDDDVQSEFSKDRASFVCRNVSTIAPLNNALNSFGNFCMIWSDTQYYHFASTTTSAQVNKTQTSLYNSYICYAGFIVGKAGITTQGTNTYALLCFDRVCPNCYRENGITKPLVFAGSTSLVKCNSCGRVYDLNNRGIIQSGDKGRKLMRYGISYGGDVMVIQN